MGMGRLAFLSGHSKERMVVPDKVAGVATHCPGGTCFGQDEGAGLTGRLHPHCLTPNR